MSVASPLSVLILSPTPPVPREYGNRNRVFQTLDFFQSQGYRISFLLYPFDDDWHRSVPPSYREMVEQFDYFAVIPNSRKLHQNAVGRYHEIDEWWDETIGMHLEWLMARKRFDILFINYTFFSKAFDYMRPGTVGILDTHDIFSGRREVFEAAGVGPEFFYTTKDREKVAYDRAHGVMAIKRSEADWIRTVTKNTVFNVPYWDTRPGTLRARSADVVFDHDRPVRVGFIGAENSVNIVNMQRFLRVLERYIEFYNAPIEVVVAGNVCKGLSDYAFLRKLGRVPYVSDFYEQVDATVAPLEFSTGIKIKVGEALAQHIPVVATRNAFDGFRAYHGTQAEPDLPTLCDALVSLAYGEISLSMLEAAAEKAAVSGQRAHVQGFRKLQEWIRTRLRRVLVLTDRSFWFRANLFDEACAQAVEYFGQVLPTMVYGRWSTPPDAKRIYAPLEFREIHPADDAIERLLREASSKFEMPMVAIMSSGGEFSDMAAAAAHRAGVKAVVLSFAANGPMDMTRFEPLAGADLPIVTSSLRYTPVSANSASSATDELALFVSEELTEWGEIAARTVEIIAADKAVRTRRFKKAPYAEFSDSFFRQCLDINSARIVCVLDDDISIAGLQQFFLMRGYSVMMLHQDFIFPEASNDETYSPSLTASVEAFLIADCKVTPPAHDAGWSNVWNRLCDAAL